MMTHVNRDVRGQADTAAADLLTYCRDRAWAGHDPYDALNSCLFEKVRLLQNRPVRILFTQAMKRSPFNIRPLMGVPEGQNSKGIALFVSALLRLERRSIVEEEEVRSLVTLLLECRSEGQAETCWGYNFSWQTRTYLVPKGTPNIICTTFAGHALIDAYERYAEPAYLEAAISAGRYLLTGLNKTKKGNSFCFSYTPLDHAEIHNANLLGAAFLARLYSFDKNKTFLEHALASTNYSVEKQKPDGSWVYGERRTQAWIDNFHTGFNLIALKQIIEFTGCETFQTPLSLGYKFYLEHFFEPDGTAKYFHDRTYPLDIHAVAQSLITLSELKALDSSSLPQACEVFQWAHRHMRSKEGYFYFQKGRVVLNKVAYMRWSQAWMLLALTVLVDALNE